MASPANLATRFPPIAFGFGLKEEPGFTPPSGVVELRGKERVDIEVALGVHYFFTCLTNRDPTFEVVEEFIGRSNTDAHGLHVFQGSTFSSDSEMNIADSQRFSKFIGIAFMAQYAGATWFSSLGSIWNKDLNWSNDTVCFEKEDAGRDGPDYIAAPFDPTAGGAPDPLFALEFKGRVKRVDFDHSAFGDWRAQAANIQCLLGAARERQRLKAWVLAFNYAFETGDGCRPHSTLLVDDPITGGSDAPALARNHITIEPVVRAHLARQCRQLGAGRLASSVLIGREAAPPSVLPTIYEVRHPRLANRRYIGWFASWGPGGELIWASSPMSGLGSDVDVYVDSTREWIHIRARSRKGVIVNADIQVRGIAPAHPSAAEQLVRLILGEDRGEIFVGQDATMLREAIAVAPGRGLDGSAFRDPIEFSVAGGEGDSPFSIQVLRNGGVFADARAVQSDDSREWWSLPQ